METPKFSLKGQLPRGDLVYWQYCLLPAPNQLFKKLPFPWIERSKITKKVLVCRIILPLVEIVILVKPAKFYFIYTCQIMEDQSF